MQDDNDVSPSSTSPRRDVVPDLVGLSTEEFMERLDDFTVGFAEWLFLTPGEDGPVGYYWLSREISGRLPSGVITATWPTAGEPFTDGPIYDDCLTVVVDDAVDKSDLARGWAFYPLGSNVKQASTVGWWAHCQPQTGISVESAAKRSGSFRSIEITYFVDQISSRPSTHYCIVPDLRWGFFSAEEDHPVGCTATPIDEGELIGTVVVRATACSGSDTYCDRLPNYGAQKKYDKLSALQAGDPHDPWLTPSPTPLCWEADLWCPNDRDRRP